MRIVYMGTPDFAVPALEALAKSGHDVVAVVTQPDKARDRGKKVQFTPVKAKALEYDIPVLQPEKVKHNEEFYRTLAELKPDLIVVAAYGKILPVSVLELPKYGCVNIHASLLPKYRGAAPIHRAMINGEPVPYCLARIPQAGETRGNLAAGGRGEARALSERDRWIAAQVGPEMKRRGMRFVGLDVIGDYLTEVNVTSPTCARELDAQFGLNICGQLFDAIEAGLAP